MLRADPWINLPGKIVVMRRGGDFQLSAWCTLVALVGCATATTEDTEVIPEENAGSGGAAGAAAGVGGTPTGGTPTTGGTSTGGTPMTGGTSTGGTPMTGGTGTGGTPMTGGTAGQGGASGSGGSSSGAAGKGGSPFGGASMGGSGGAGGASGGKGGVGGSASGGKGGSGGSSSGGKGGASGAGGSGGGATIPCDNPRMPAQTANSGNFMTTMAVCYEVTATFNAWRCSSIGTRTVSVNGTPVMCSDAMGTWPLPARIDGSYFFSFSAGTPDYTSFYWYTQ